MKKLVLAVAAALVLNVPVFAGSVDNARDFKSLAPKMLKSPKASADVKSTKDDVSIVYGGEDISRKIMDLSAIA